VRARRGDPDVEAPLAEARGLAEPTGELQRLAPVASASAEALWLEGRPEAVDEATVGALEEAVRRSSTWVIGELVYWRRLAGLRDDVDVSAAVPYSLQIAGSWAEAAACWREIGNPYQAALALAEADDPAAVRTAFDELQRLGARPALAIVSHRLRELGVRGVPRGPRATTRENPANLTPRELEVLALVSEGLRNAEIAARLFVTEKTVGHHVSAILRKLRVRTRTEAGAEAARLGLTL
jgi:DNA-binding CsgD family transcriptional regulator